jgi:hypothetical protein
MVTLNPLKKLNKGFIIAMVVFIVLFVASSSLAVYFYYKYDQLKSLGELTKAIENQPTRVVDG